MNAVTQARDAAVQVERHRMQRMLDEALRIGEGHLHDKIILLDLIERAIAHLRRDRCGQAMMLLQRAVEEVKIGQV